MKYVVALLPVTLLVAASLLAHAAVINVKYETAVFEWEWEQGDGPMADGFIIKAGPAPDNYPYFITIPDPTARSVLVKSFVPVKGVIYAIGYAYNVDEQSDPSNTVNAKLIGPLRPMVSFRVR